MMDASLYNKIPHYSMLDMRSRECSSLHSSGLQLNEDNSKQMQRSGEEGLSEKNIEEDMHELQSLSKRLFMKNCGVSVVCMLLLVCLVGGIHIFEYVQFQIYQRGLASFDVGEKLMFQTMFTHYSQTIDYFHYTLDLTLNALSVSLISPPLQLYYPTLNQPHHYPQIFRKRVYTTRGGLQCITPQNQHICLMLNSLSPLLWQYSQVLSMKNFLKQIIICANVSAQSLKTDEYGCVGVPITGAYSNNTLKKYLQSNQYFFHEQFQNRGLVLSELDEEFTIGQYYSLQGNETIPIFIMMKLSKSLSSYLTNSIDGTSIFAKNAFMYKLNLTSAYDSNQSISFTQILSANGSKIPELSPSDYFSTTFSFQENKNNGFLIKFQFTYYEQLDQTSSWKFQTGLFAFLFIIYIAFFEVRNIKNYIYDLFYRKQLLNQLYKFSIKEIFTGKRPVLSFVMKKGPLGPFFYQLSQVIDRSLSPIISEKCTQLKRKSFKFKNKTQTLVDSYRSIISNLMQTKNRQILNNRFSIQSYINSVCESEADHLKQYYLKAAQSNILLQFFKFGYMAILRVPEKYVKFVKEDTCPMPEELIRYFSRINKQIHEVDVMRQRIQLEIMRNSFKSQNNEENSNCIQNENRDSLKKQLNINNLKQIDVSEINDNQSTPTHVEILKKPNRDLFSKNRSKFKEQRRNLRDKVESDQSVGEVVMFSNTEMHEPEMSYNNSERRQSRKKSVATKSRENNTMSNLESVEVESKENWEEQETKDELQIRIRVLMIPKYLAMFKDLDFENHYAKKLELQKQLINLSDIIDNTRYLLTRHNKNIRVFSKPIL